MITVRASLTCAYRRTSLGPGILQSLYRRLASERARLREYEHVSCLSSLAPPSARETGAVRKVSANAQKLFRLSSLLSLLSRSS
jgi:hypothetical protein